MRTIDTSEVLDYIRASRSESMGLGDAAIVNGIIHLCGGKPTDFTVARAADRCNCGADEAKGRFHVPDCPEFADSPASQALFYCCKECAFATSLIDKADDHQRDTGHDVRWPTPAAQQGAKADG